MKQSAAPEPPTLDPPAVAPPAVAPPAVDPPAVAALAALATALPRLSGLEDLIDAVAEAMCAAVEVDSVHVGRVEMAQGVVRVLRNAGRLEPWEEGRPVAETYSLRDHPELVQNPTSVDPWVGTMSERHGPRPYRSAPLRAGDDERELHGLRVPILHATGVWGALLLRRRSGPFSQAEEQVAQIGAGLLAAGIARVLGDETLRRAGLHRLAHRPAEPPLRRRAARAVGRRRRGRGLTCSWCSATSTGSSRSTTGTATSSATG